MNFENEITMCFVKSQGDIMKNHFNISQVIVVCIFLLQGCSTYSLKECESFDWNERGYLNALDGKSENFGIAHYHEACNKKYKIEVNIKEFKLGYQKGLQIFCMPEKALEFGNKGGTYLGTCPQEKEPNFLNKYTLGFNQFLKEKVEKLERENSYLESQISSLQSENSLLESKISSLESEVSSLR